MIRAALLLAVAAIALPAQQVGVDVTRYVHQLTLPDTGKTIRAVTLVQFTRSSAVRTLKLDLLAPMRVARVSTGCPPGDAAPARHRHAEGVLEITLPEGSGRGCVRVQYSGAPTDGLVISTDSAGRWQAFGDNWPNRARHWLATVDHPSDKALVEFHVEAPAARTVVANGTKRGVEELPARAGSGPRRRTIWATQAPIPTYLMVIAAAEMTEYSLGPTACGLGSVARCVPQQVFTAPEQARHLPGNFRFADDIVRFFARTVAPYPFEQLAHLQSSTRFGGMENAGAIFYADRLFREPNGVSVGLIAHEAAHQWFGNTVTQREWGHLWLSEGFATYFAALYTEHAQGDSAFRAEMDGIRRRILGASVVAERPVVDTAQTDLMQLLNANSYQKGGFVLHMLRSEVGDSAFFRGVRAYYAAHRQGNALTPDLRAAVEQEAGRDLKWFFDQWLRRPGFAQLRTEWSHDAETGELALLVTQGDRFPPYRFTLRVAVEGADGAVTDARVEVPAESSARVLVPGVWTAAPRAVRPDPRVELLAEFRAP
jgi:aminopeptidase N